MHLSIEGRPGPDQSLRVLAAVLDAGVTLIDTADAYCLDEREVGHNERLIAGALRAWGGDRSSVIVATKGGVIRHGPQWDTDGRPEHLREACDRSLQALGVERIDLYQLHAPDPKVPFPDSVGAMADLRAQGKVRWVGLSNVSVDQIRQAENIVPITSVQNRLNPFFKESLVEGVVRYCEDRGIGFLAYSPTGGRRLTRKLADHPVLAPMARRLGVSAHALVLAWALSRSSTMLTIPSARHVEHALDSISAGELVLSAEDLAWIDRAEFSRS